MGKIRVKTLGIDEIEKQEKKEAKKRKEAKIAQKQEAASVAEETKTEEAKPAKEAVEVKTKEKPQKKEASKKSERSKRYKVVAKMTDKNKLYSLSEALELLPKLHLAKFDETVELHVNLTEKGISGNVTLPHGTGKKVRVVIADPSQDSKAFEDLIKRIEGGKIDFDVLIAKPEAMPKLSRVAKVLGPRGLMPNPKNGTVTQKPEELAKKYEGGQMSFKTESTAPIIHLAVGKMSFGEKKLEENIKEALKALPSMKIQSVTLKSTMSPSLRLKIS